MRKFNLVKASHSTAKIWNTIALAKRAKTHLGNMTSHWRFSHAVTARQTSLIVSMLRVSFSVNTIKPTLKEKRKVLVDGPENNFFSFIVNVTLLLES